VGSHENYMVERRACRENLDLLVPYVILRQVFCGAGGYVDGRYMVSPRAVFPSEVFSEVSTDYPLISTRDESHTGKGYSRAHIVNGEGTRSEYTTLLKHAFTGYVLRAIERGHLRTVPEIASPIESNKTVAANLDGDWVVPLRDGTTMKATDYLNSYYLEAVERLFADASPGGRDRNTLREFKWVLGKLDEGLIETLDTSIEWVIKLSLAENYLAELDIEDGLDPDTAKTAALFQYTAVTDPLYEELVERHGLNTVVSEADVEKAFNGPPEESRGELRVALARRFKDEVKTISWSYFKAKPELHMHPFEFNDLGGWTPERIEDKISEIRAWLT
jgi:hypothetical protein